MKIIFPLLFLTMTFNNLKAQDTITLKTGTSIKCRVTEVGVTEIKYKKQDTSEVRVYTIEKKKISVINYKDGSSDFFNEITSKGLFMGLHIIPSFTNSKSNIIKLQLGDKIQSLNTLNYFLGIAFSYNFSNHFNIGTGLDYSQYSTTYKYANLSFDEYKVVDCLNFVTIPLKFSFLSGKSNKVCFYFDLGPQLGFFISEKTKSEGSSFAHSYVDFMNTFKTHQLFGSISFGCHLPFASHHISMNIGPAFNYGLINGFSGLQATQGAKFTSYSYGLMLHLQTKVFSL